MIIFHTVPFGEPYQYIRCRNLLINNEKLSILFDDITHPNAIEMNIRTVNLRTTYLHYDDCNYRSHEFPIWEAGIITI